VFLLEIEISVAMQEDVHIEESGKDRWAIIPPGLKHGADRRLAGEDAKEGAVLTETGIRLRPQEVAAAAAAGLAFLLYKRPLPRACRRGLQRFFFLSRTFGVSERVALIAIIDQFRELAYQAAVAKARELGWIV
jgi:MoeA N-terminal region (domain I and II)